MWINIVHYRVLRTRPKVKINFLCSRLRDKLDSEVQLSKNIFEFVSRIKKLNLDEY